ncbi:MAG: carboxypeptidase-like regulatory domain-containing protein, partial [Gemmatimonadaceae bacterium]
AGEFRILGIPPGNHVVVVRHLGSAPITVSLDLAVGDTVIREFDLAPAVPAPPALDTVSVRARLLLSAVTLGKMAGYESRRAQHIGRSIDSTTLQRENYRDLGDILRAHLPIHLLVTEGGSYVGSTRGMVSDLNGNSQPAGDSGDRQRGAGPACYAQVYVDGIRLYTPAQGAKLFDVNSIPVTGLKAVEYFPGAAETPPEYGGTGASCGTLLIWTR